MKSIRNHSILIIGCGWIGKKLGNHLHSQKMTVYGTTRSPSNFSDLESHNIKPIQFELPVSSASNIQLPETDIVVISISPGRGEGRKEYPRLIRQISKVMADSNKQVILYSSTSAYGNIKNTVTENEAQPDPESSNIILAAEGEVRAQLPESTILRLSGLFGEDRHPVKYLAGRSDIKDGDSPVNLVHRDDVIRASELVMEQQIRGEVINVCAPEHPSKKEIYTTIAARLNLEEPTFLEGGEDGKSISSSKLMEQYGFEFSHPDPLQYNRG